MGPVLLNNSKEIQEKMKTLLIFLSLVLTISCYTQYPGRCQTASGKYPNLRTHEVHEFGSTDDMCRLRCLTKLARGAEWFHSFGDPNDCYCYLGSMAEVDHGDEDSEFTCYILYA